MVTMRKNEIGMMSKLIKGKSWFGILLLIGLITIFSGCINPQAGIDAQTRQTLQNAINTLGSQPGQWQNTMTVTIDELGRVGTTSAKEVLADVQSTYNGALGQTESASFCGADFIGHRLQQRLQAILHKYDNTTPEPKIVPVICTTNPADHISAGQSQVNDAGKTQYITYYGYDFLEFSKNQTFTADFEYGSGQIVNPNFGFVRIPHNYELVLDIQAADYRNVDRSKGPAVALKWGGQNVAWEGSSSILPVIIPTPTPTPTPNPTKWTWLNFEADQWGGIFSGWDQRHDYTEYIPIDSGWHWDGDTNSVKNSLTYTTSNWGSRGTPSAYVIDDPVLENGQVKVRIHVGAQPDGTSPHIYIKIGAQEIKD
ncbi:MAG: hypothetical protein WCE94_01740 [Candidatus Methanoperedens sp.]